MQRGFDAKVLCSCRVVAGNLGTLYAGAGAVPTDARQADSFRPYDIGGAREKQASL